jgi:hypothetical protein
MLVCRAHWYECQCSGSIQCKECKQEVQCLPLQSVACTVLILLQHPKLRMLSDCSHLESVFNAEETSGFRMYIMHACIKYQYT